MLSVLVVNRDRREDLDRCLVSIAAAARRLEPGVELIVVDNASRDGSLEMLAERHPEARVVAHDVNTGFAPAVAEATGLARGEWLALINNDAWLEPPALERMLAAGVADPRVGAVCAQVRFAGQPEIINTAGLEIDALGVAYDRLAGAGLERSETTAVEVFGASGCVVLYRLAMLREIGGFDASFFAFAEDADVAWRARMAGWRTIYEPRAVAFHVGSATAGERSDFKYALVGRNRMRLLAKNAATRQLLVWGIGMLAYDLAYVLYVALADRSLAPLRGRLTGLGEWRRYRRAGAGGRRAVPMAGGVGALRALRMRGAYAAHSGLRT